MRAVLICLAVLSLAACATVQRLPAAGDVHALLIAIRDNDQAKFDSLVDRRALDRQIGSILVEKVAAKDSKYGALASLLAPSLAKQAGDMFIQPEVFHAVAEHYGYTSATKIPNIIYIAQALRPLPDGRVCAMTKKDGPCLLDFTKAEDGRWKLSGFEGDTSMLRLKR